MTSPVPETRAGGLVDPRGAPVVGREDELSAARWASASFGFGCLFALTNAWPLGTLAVLAAIIAALGLGIAHCDRILANIDTASPAEPGPVGEGGGR